jgi:CDP-glucose 4,6-dehydratase
MGQRHGSVEGLGMMDATFWCGKRIFLTGHTGFKGSWFSRWLVSLGAEVCGYSLEPPTEPNLFSALRLADSISHVLGDVRDFDRLSRCLVEFRPEFVFHLAAQPLVRLSYKDPRLTYETNVMGTLNLYEAVRSCDSVRVVVSITTDKCYENREWIWGYRENDPMGGYDPYSSSKGCAELLSSAYRNSFFNPEGYGKSHHVALATARAGNVIGGGDWAIDRLIPDCVRSLSAGRAIPIRSPRATRPWQHVLEPLSGYMTLAQRMYTDGVAYSGGWNFGPSDEGVMDVENVVKRVIDAWGGGSYSIMPDADYHEAHLLKLDISKARSLLKWAPKLDTSRAIKETIAVYKLFGKSDTELSDTVEEQISSYTGGQ